MDLGDDEKMVRRILLISILMLILIGITGCRSSKPVKETSPSVQTSSIPTNNNKGTSPSTQVPNNEEGTSPNTTFIVPNNAIPFFYLTEPVNSQDLKAFPAYWDLDKGAVELSAIPILESPDNSWYYNYSWDGGKNIFLLTDNPTSYSFPSSIYNCTALQTDDPFSIAIFRSDLNLIIMAGKQYIEIKHNNNLQKLDMSSEVPEGSQIDRTISLSSENNEIHAIVECNNTNNQYSLYEISCLDTSMNILSCKQIAKDLDINEAGSGTQMIKYGNSIYIGKQSGDIETIDLNTGISNNPSNLNKLISDFKNEYIKYTEYEVPPNFFSYHGYLFLEWFPAVIDSPQGDRNYNVGFLAALKDGKVQGLIQIYKNKATIIKDDTVVEQVDLSADMIPALELPK
jgi:hypothetical protein